MSAQTEAIRILDEGGTREEAVDIAATYIGQTKAEGLVDWLLVDRAAPPAMLPGWWWVR